MDPTKTAGAAGALTTPESPRLAPMASMSDAPPRHPGMDACAGEDIRQKAAHQIAVLCGEILRGARPLMRLRRRSNRIAFAEFSRIYGRMQQRRRDSCTVVRVSRLVIGCDETTELVLTVRSGSRVRALAMQVQHDGPDAWRLTSCHLVGGY